MVRSHVHMPFDSAPAYWAESYTHRECTLHQLSPYIGKLKSIIARDLILQYSKPGDLLADVFCGSGTVPLEGVLLGRRVFASDTSKYAVTLTKGKLNPPVSQEQAVKKLPTFFERAEKDPLPSLSDVPEWVRKFFHPRTLSETLRLTRILQRRREYFYLGAILGILHHQRPGFLSYPSSHLVPYLRTKKFPRSSFPDLYAYRSIEPRLEAKVKRLLKRIPNSHIGSADRVVRQSSAKSINLPDRIDCVVTSPPYMNALDYKRDNRLRLWLLGEPFEEQAGRTFASEKDFKALMDKLASQLNEKVRIGGYCIFVVGDKTFRGCHAYPSEILNSSFSRNAPRLRLVRIVEDVIPDVRRARKWTAGVKQENILVFRKF